MINGTDMLNIPFPAQPYTGEKRIENGNPVLYINGEKCAPMIYAMSDIPASNPLTAQAQRNISNFAAQGIHLIYTDVSLYIGWHKTGAYNPDFLFGSLTAILETDPEAAIILRLHMNAPYWWMRDNPDELCIFGSGGVPYIDKGEYERLIIGDENNDMRVSLASQKWIDDASAAAGALLSMVKDTPQGQHIVGIQIACGVYGEWHQWGFSYDPDYSKPMIEYLRHYLHDKYGDNESLRKAWHDDTVTFDTALPASPYERYHEGIAPYRDPEADRRVVDSLTALQKSVPDAIIHFANYIRDIWQRPILLGTFYGYYDPWGKVYIGGHLEVKMLSESGTVDYFSAPFRYDSALRGVSGATSARGLLESCRLNGILWLTEMDNPPLGSKKFIGGDPDKRAESIASMRRNVLEPFTRGMGMWFFDHRLVLDTGMGCSVYVKKGWWDNPVLLREVKMLRHIAQYCQKKPYKPRADVLLVFGSESLYYSNAYDAFTGNECSLFLSIGKSGVAYDSIYIHDIEKAEFQRYRCVIFVNCSMIAYEKRKFIRENVTVDGRNIIWINTAGILDANSLDISNISDITGFELKDAKTQGDVVYSGLLPDTTVKCRCRYSLSFSPQNGEVIGCFEDTGETAAAVRRTDNCIIWYFSQFPADSVLLRHIFKMSGAHIYSENGEAVMAGNGILTVTSVEKSNIHITLKNGHVIDDILDAMTTAVYDEESGERLDTKFYESETDTL